MAKLTLEGSTTIGDYPVLPPDTIIGVEVLDVEERQATNNKTGESWQKLEFSFQIASVPSQLGTEFASLVGSRIWGSTPIRFTMHPDNRLRQWIEALLGGLELDEGFEFDTDSLVGRRARAIVSNYPKKDGRFAHQVSGLLPSADAAPPTVAAEIFAEVPLDDPPF